MMKSSVTISLVPEARSGPFIFHGDLEKSLESAASIGFDGVELFLPGAEAVQESWLGPALKDRGLTLSALGTGAGYLLNGWTLSDPSRSVREKAIRFIEQLLCLASQFEAPVIVGSMQGSSRNREEHDEALPRLIDSLERLASTASHEGTEILLEPLNRYETNLVNTLQQGVDLLKKIPGSGIRLLADLFHMNIEEQSLTHSLREAAEFVGHVHFVDSNRRAAGFGHLKLGEISEVLHQTGFEGYLSAEALPYPDSTQAAEQSLASFDRHIRPKR
jgi:sugar phosphate isomerase/epimerase